MNIKECMKRYRNDANFHAAVDAMRRSILDMRLTPSEVRDAATFAAYLVEMYRVGPMSEKVRGLEARLSEAVENIAGSVSDDCVEKIEAAYEARIAELEAALRAAAPWSCSECGDHVKVDEDGCCAHCGRDATRVLDSGEWR